MQEVKPGEVAAPASYHLPTPWRHPARTTRRPQSQLLLRSSNPPQQNSGVLAVARGNQIRRRHPSLPLWLPWQPTHSPPDTNEALGRLYRPQCEGAPPEDLHSVENTRCIECRSCWPPPYLRTEVSTHAWCQEHLSSACCLGSAALEPGWV